MVGAAEVVSEAALAVHADALVIDAAAHGQLAPGNAGIDSVRPGKAQVRRVLVTQRFEIR